MWSTLADQIGLAYTPVDTPAGFDRLTASVGVITAGGAEEELEAALRQALTSDGPHLVVAKVTTADRAESGAFSVAPFHLTENSVEFRRALDALRG